MWICLKLKQAGDNEKGWLESPYQLKRVLRYTEREDYTRTHLPKSRSATAVLPTLQPSPHQHKRGSEATATQLQQEECSMRMGTYGLSCPYITCSVKIHSTCNTRLLRRLISFKAIKITYGSNYDFSRHRPCSRPQTSPLHSDHIVNFWDPTPPTRVLKACSELPAPRIPKLYPPISHLAEC